MRLVLEQAILAVRQIRSASTFDVQPISIPALGSHVKAILDSVLLLLATLPGPGDSTIEHCNARAHAWIAQ